MSLPRYPSYKDSCVEGIGQVPRHWQVSRLRFVVELNPSKVEVRELPRDTRVSFLPMEAIGDDGTLKLDQERPIREVENGFTYFRDGDVVVAKITPCYENGKGALMQGLVSGIGFGTTELIVVRPKSNSVTGQYLHYLFTSHEFRSIGESYMYGAGGQKRVPDSFVRNYLIAYPPLSEQHLLVTFLDRETAKIDALVAEQQRLVELLKEKRQAVISHAVTKGLNPDATMKPSGVDWLGDVPSHWIVTSIKYFSKLQRGHDLTDSERTDGTYPVVTSGGVSGTHGAFMAHGPGVVTGRYGSIGRLFYIETDFWPHNTSLYVVDFHGNEPRFSWYTLQTVDFAAHSAKAAVPGIDRNDIHVLPVAVPPTAEQRQITSYLDQAMANLDLLTTEAQRAIDLLQERRSALISAAVTGQIDVRGLAQQEAA
jgi:type I restriction enzyme, S subunit